ncbi:MAG: DUF3418 domain-containing protein, partial [Planctomycetota bacterium]
EDDGVSITIHQAAITQVSDERLGWLVPGLLEQKIVAMIKSLPKRLRRNLVPAADVAKKIYHDLLPVYGEVPFATAVCEQMTRHAETPIHPSDFQSDKLDQHFEFMVEVVDDSGDVLAKSRSVAPLVSEFASQPSTPSQPTECEQDLPTGKLVEFPDTPLPKEIVQRRGGVRVAQYPALADHGDHVRVTLMPDAESAARVHTHGMVRIFALTERKELRRQVRWLPNWEATKLHLSGSVPAASLEASLIDLLARIAFVENEPEIRDVESLKARRENRMERISVATQEVASWLTEFGERAMQVRSSLESFPKHQLTEAYRNLCECRDGLLHDECLSVTPWKWLKHYPRYLHAISYRIDKLRSGSGTRDTRSSDEINRLQAMWFANLPEEERDLRRHADSEFRWMIEELRVSLFAQPLGTSVKVSPTRCEKLLKTSRAAVTPS